MRHAPGVVGHTVALAAHGVTVTRVRSASQESSNARLQYKGTIAVAVCVFASSTTGVVTSLRRDDTTMATVAGVLLLAAVLLLVLSALRLRRVPGAPGRNVSTK